MKKLKVKPWNGHVADFGSDLKAGQKGQEKIVRAGKGLLRELDGRKNDLELVRTKEKVELKTERYNLKRNGKFSRATRSTPNLFIERWSDEKRGHIGGPFQALAKGNKFYVHLFKNNKVVVFKTQELVDYLNKIDFTQKYAKKKSNIPNKSGKKDWMTVGYYIPLEDIAHLAVITGVSAYELQRAFKNIKRRTAKV